MEEIGSATSTGLSMTGQGKEQILEGISELSQTVYERLMVAYAEPWLKTELTMAQFRVLAAVVSKRRAESRHLHRRLNMLPSTLTRIVDPLVERGLLVRESDRRDRRVVHLVATMEGVHLVRRLTLSSMPELMSMALSKLPPEELLAVHDGLRVLAKAVREVNQPS